MFYKFKIKFKNKNEIIALILLLSITVILTSYYNYTKSKINNSYKDVINNVYFKKTANHFLNNLEPKFKKINHKISLGETFNSILKNYSVDDKEIEIIKQKLSEKINLNKLNTNQKIFLIIDQSNSSIKEFVFQVSNKERVVLTRNVKNNEFEKEVLLLKLNKEVIYKENVILQSLYKSASDKNIPPNAIIELARIYGFQVDFQRDIRK